MNENLYLRMGDGFIEWLLLNETTGEVRFRGQGDFESFRSLVPGMLGEPLENEDEESPQANINWQGHTYAMLRAEEVFITKANVPSKQPRQILRAVPFMVEEQLATDVDSCHFAVGKRDDEGNVGVAVIDRDKLAAYVDDFSELGLRLDYLGVDCLSVPWTDTSTIMFDSDRALIRSGEHDALSVPSDMIAMTVSMLPETAQRAFTLSLHESELADSGILRSQLEAEYDADVEVIEREYESFEQLCRQLDKTSINLLQGAFKVEKPKGAKSSPWKNVVVLAACAFSLHLAVLFAQAYYYDSKATEYDVAAKALYKDIFPNDRNVRNLKRRWRSHLGSAGGQSQNEFLSLFSETVKNLPGSPLTLKNVNFNSSRGDLILQLETRRSDQLIAFSETLGKLGLIAEIGTISNQGDNLVKGSIKVKGLGDS